MPTPSEQKALAFVAIVIVLGGAARVVRAGAAPAPSAMEQQALARQATAAESAASASRQKKGSRGRTPRTSRDEGERVVGGLAGSTPKFDRTGVLTPETGINGFPPPGPRIDTDARRGTFGSNGAGTPDRRGQATGPRLDLDVASVAEIDRLPRVGPSLARRIVASRDSGGPFRSLEGLRRVKGVGAGTLEQLAPLVTFSGRASSRP